MTYDLHGSWDNFADHHAPLKERSYDYWPFNTLNAVSIFTGMDWQSFWSILQPKVDWIKGFLSVSSFHVLNQEQVIGLNIITSNNQPPVQLVLFYLVKSRLFPLIGYHKLV